MTNKATTSVDRRSFLAAAAGAAGAVGAASAAPVAAAAASLPQVTAAAPAAAGAAGAARLIRPSALTELAALEVAQATGAQAQIAAGSPSDPNYHVANPGSDFMVDCLKALGYEYVAATPGSTFRGFQESVINYPGSGGPEWLTATHEEISAAMAHGYAKASGKPMAFAVHGVVGVQHAAMGVYNAYADRVPMLLLTANYADGALRNEAAEWDHNATDMLAMLRGFVKYDEQPGSLQHFAESLARAHGLAMTPPYGPVALVMDQFLQESTITGNPSMKPFVPVSPPAADANAIADIAKMLVAAQNPVIVVDRATRTQAGVDLLVQLAEALQAPVVDRLGRMNFPTNHYLWSQLPVAWQADLILALDVGDLFDVVGDVPDITNRKTIMHIRPGTKVISIDAELNVPQANYQDKQRFYQPDYPVAGDSEASLPSLIEAVNRAMTDARRNQNADRSNRFKNAFAARRAADANAAAVAWDASPISVPRMVMELWNQIKGLDFALVSQATFQSFWQQRLWDMTKHYNYLGPQGAAGIGYTGPASVGAALAHRNDGIISVSIQGDGDFMFFPGSHWSAAHHKLPLLTLIHNNRAWHEELMFLQVVADRRNRHPERAEIGTTITNPNIDYAKIASGLGVYGQGPISNPDDLGPAIVRALAVVKRGEPALIDVVSQGR
jgi:thiamine pyrophosphate-dependent acetolactate synthase large subunit-like protein